MCHAFLTHHVSREEQWLQNSPNVTYFSNEACFSHGIQWRQNRPNMKWGVLCYKQPTFFSHEEQWRQNVARVALFYKQSVMFFARHVLFSFACLRVKTLPRETRRQNSCAHKQRHGGCKLATWIERGVGTKRLVFFYLTLHKQQDTPTDIAVICYWELHATRTLKRDQGQAWKSPVCKILTNKQHHWNERLTCIVRFRPQAQQLEPTCTAQ